MIKRRLINNWKPFVVALLFIVLTAVNTAYCQFLNLNLNIHNKLKITTIRQLDFGTLLAESGKNSVPFGSKQMGVFSITALENQTLFINIQEPASLHQQNTNSQNNIPLKLSAKYGYSLEHQRDARYLPLHGSTINVKASSGSTPWEMFYIFIYGSVDVGDVASGQYANVLTLSVEYM